MFNISLVFMPTFCIVVQLIEIDLYAILTRDINSPYGLVNSTQRFFPWTWQQRKMSLHFLGAVISLHLQFDFYTFFRFFFSSWPTDLLLRLFDCNCISIITAIITIRSDICSICCCHRRPLITYK